MAGKGQQEFTEKDITGLKYFDRLLPMAPGSCCPSGCRCSPAAMSSR